MIIIAKLFRPAALVMACGVAAALLAPMTARAETDKYRVTAAEKAACTVDAMRLCSDTYPDEDRLLGCMKTNRASLSTVCRVAFDAGVKRRRL